MSLFIESWKRDPNMAAVRDAKRSSAGKNFLSLVIFLGGVLLPAQRCLPHLWAKIYWNYCTYFKRKTGIALLKMCIAPYLG